MRSVRYLRKPKESKHLTRGIAVQNKLLDLVEKRLAQEADIRDAVMRSHTPDVYHSAPSPTGGDGSGHARVDDPTAALAIQSACPLDLVRIEWQGNSEVIPYPEVWLEVFDAVRRAGDCQCREIIRRRFGGEAYHDTCRDLFLSTSTYYHHVREILHYTLACAIQAGLLRPDALFGNASLLSIDTEESPCPKRSR